MTDLVDCKDCETLLVSGEFGDVDVSSVAIGRNLPKRDCRGLSMRLEFGFGFTRISMSWEGVLFIHPHLTH
jgi:hypothetical protein